MTNLDCVSKFANFLGLYRKEFSEHFYLAEVRDITFHYLPFFILNVLYDTKLDKIYLIF